MPKEPMLETVKVPPDRKSGAMVPSIALLARRLASSENALRPRACAERMTGTKRPRGVSHAKPR